MKKKLFTVLCCMLLSATMILPKHFVIQASAKSTQSGKSKAAKSTTYKVQMARITTFHKKGGKLTVKLEKGATFSTGSNSHCTKRIISLKLAKNCKWLEEDTAPSTHKSSYAKMKKILKQQRKRRRAEGAYYWDSSPFGFSLTIKGKKITKVSYIHS